MRNKRITKAVVEKLEPQEKSYCVWDPDLKGFGVRCQPTGAKYYLLKTRIGGDQRWFTIGRHGSPWTTDAARQEALRILGEKASGKDPAATRATQKIAVTVRDLGDRYIREHAEIRCKPRTVAGYRQNLDHHINPALGQKKIVNVTKEDVKRLHHGLRSTPYQANRVVTLLNGMMNFAEDMGLRPEHSNPCYRLKKYKEETRKRYLTEQEIIRLGQVLRQVEEGNEEDHHAIAAIRLMLLTGARRSEILTLKWSYVDREQGLLRLPDSKTGAKDIVLTPEVEKILDKLSLEGNEYLIAGDKPGTHLADVKGAWKRITQRAGIEGVRKHDLRHTYGTLGVTDGQSLRMIGDLLGHKQAQTTHRYAHADKKPRNKVAERLSEKIGTLLNSTGA